MVAPQLRSLAAAALYAAAAGTLTCAQVQIGLGESFSAGAVTQSPEIYNVSSTISPKEIAELWLFTHEPGLDNIPGQLVTESNVQNVNPSVIRTDLIGSSYVGADVAPSSTDQIYQPLTNQALTIAVPIINGTSYGPSGNGTNSLNTINTAYWNATAHNIHFSTPFELNSLPTIAYGTSPSSLTKTAVGFSSTYGGVCSSVNYTICNAYYHNVLLTGLSGYTQYYYQIQNDSSGLLASTIYSFKSALPAGDATPFNVSIFADMGMTNAGNTHNGLLALANSTDFIFHNGDISYADTWNYALAGVGGANGGDVFNTYEGSWDIWQYWMNNITTVLPYMVSPGNHEAGCIEGDGGADSCPLWQRNFTAYRYRFRMPSAASGAGNVQNMWWSMDYGLVHFISIDTETDGPDQEGPDLDFSAEASGDFGGGSTGNPSQLAWLQADLAKVNRTLTPWVIVGGHRPLYSNENSGYSKQERAVFEQIFLHYNVDIYYSGHIHWYERIYPINNGTVITSAVNKIDNFTSVDNAVIHVIAGAAGNIENHNDDPGVPFIDAALNWANYGFGQLQVHSATELEWIWMDATTGVVADRMYVVKPSTASGTAAPVATNAPATIPVLSPVTNSSASTGSASRLSTPSSTGVAGLKAKFAKLLA